MEKCLWLSFKRSLKPRNCVHMCTSLERVQPFPEIFRSIYESIKEQWLSACGLFPQCQKTMRLNYFPLMAHFQIYNRINEKKINTSFFYLGNFYEIISRFCKVTVPRTVLNTFSTMWVYLKSDRPKKSKEK